MAGYRMSEHDQCCRFCKERYVGCHAECEKGKEAERKWKEYKELVDKKRDFDLAYKRFKDDQVIKTKEKARKARVKK